MTTTTAGDALTARFDALIQEARTARGRLPGDAYDLVTAFARAGLGVASRLDALGWGSVRASLVRAVDTERELIARWLAIPDDYTGPTGEERASADAILREGLSRMLGWVESARQAVATADAASLLLLGEALTFRYGPTFDAPAELGQAPRPAAPGVQWLTGTTVLIIAVLLVVLGSCLGGAR